MEPDLLDEAVEVGQRVVEHDEEKVLEAMPEPHSSLSRTVRRCAIDGSLQLRVRGRLRELGRIRRVGRGDRACGADRTGDGGGATGSESGRSGSPQSLAGRPRRYAPGMPAEGWRRPRGPAS